MSPGSPWCTSKSTADLENICQKSLCVRVCKAIDLLRQVQLVCSLSVSVIVASVHEPIFGTPRWLGAFAIIVCVCACLSTNSLHSCIAMLHRQAALLQHVQLESSPSQNSCTHHDSIR